MEESFKNAIMRFIAIFSFLLAIFIMFDASLRTSTAVAAGYIFNNTISFESRPVLTIFLAGIILVFLTTLIRHVFIDWLKVAKSQKVMGAFQKEFRSATLSRNLYKTKKLTEMQAEIMKGQSDMSMMQMKPMGLTLIVAIPIFVWLGEFIGRVPNKEICPFGYATISLIGKGPLLHLFPWWIIIYVFLSVPFGQIFQKAFRVIKYRKRLK